MVQRRKNKVVLLALVQGQKPSIEELKAPQMRSSKLLFET